MYSLGGNHCIKFRTHQERGQKHKADITAYDLDRLQKDLSNLLYTGNVQGTKFGYNQT